MKYQSDTEEATRVRLGLFVVFAGGSVVPGDWGVSGQPRRSQEDPSRERTDWARPYPYTRAAGNRAGERSPRAAQATRKKKGLLEQCGRLASSPCLSWQQVNMKYQSDTEEATRVRLGLFVVFAGGSVVPGDWGVSGQPRRSREDPSRERTDRARPYPYTRAAGNRAGERSPRAAPTGAELPEPTARARAREAGPRAPHKSVATNRNQGQPSSTGAHAPPQTRQYACPKHG
ncbi:hypothetical protein B0H11DRAFT_1941095 [Mycena galericulata]|nr:hypothetical protein B0H11DRAFT_1941095 [Mycena galericulata]